MTVSQVDHHGRWWGIVLLAVAVISASVLMVPLLTAGPLTLDEHGSYWLLESDVPSTVLERSLGYAAIPPLSAWVQQLFVAIGGRTEVAFRLSSAMPFVMAIFVVYQLGRELAGDTVGGLAALLLAWHPEAMDEVRIARCYGLVALLAAISFWVTVRWIRAASRWDYALIWTLAGAGLLWTHYLTAPVIGLELIALLGLIRLDQKPLRPDWKLLSISLVVLTLLASPLIPALIRMKEWNVVLSLGQPPANIWTLFGPIWIVGLFSGFAVTWILSRAGQGPVSTAVSSSTLKLFFFWGLAPLLFIAIVTNCGMAGLNNSRYRVAFAVPGVCCLAMVLASQRRRWAATVGTIILLFAAWAVQPYRPWVPTRVAGNERLDWYEIARVIRTDGHEGQAVFVQSGLVESYLVPILFNDRLFMDYVACRVGKFYLNSPHPRYALPFLWANQREMYDWFRKVIHQHYQQGDTVWVACATDTDLCRSSLPAMHSLLVEAGYQSTSRTSLSTAELVCYQVEHPSPANPPPTDVK